MGEIIKRKIKRLNWKAKIAIILCFTLIFSTFMFEGWYKPRPSYAAITVAKGTFTAGTTSITNLGFQPKLVIFFWTGNTTNATSAANGMMGIGFAGGSPIANASVATVAQDNVSTTNTGWIESATYSIQILNTNPSRTAYASVASFDTSGFTLSWTGGNNEIIHYIAIGGADITNVKVGQFNGPSATGGFSYTNVGFQPDFVMLVHPDRTSTTLDTVQNAGALNIGMFTNATQGAIGWGSRDGQTSLSHAHTLSDAHAVYGIRRNAADQVATFSSMQTNGFSLNFTTVGGQAPYIYLAIKGGNHKIGSFTKRTSAGTQAVTGLGFTPDALMLFSHNSTATNGAVDTADPAASLSIGAAGGGANGAVWMHDRTVINTDVNMISYNNAVMKMGASNNGITNYGQATLQSFDTDGFTLNWSSSDGTARRILYWAMGGIADSTPPTAGTVTVSPDLSGYTSSSPTITTQFTDNESSVTSCEYTTNGTTWSAGTLSGTAPTWTCTANPIGLSGTLTINMRAISSGGTGTATPITRTVDATAPTDGTLTATAGNTQVALTWSGFSDAGSGLSSTDPYKLVYSTTGFPNAGCTNGTDITAVTTQTSYTHTGLTNGTTYYYRLCAIDAMGNTSSGVTASATPNSASWQIISCAGCHGYTGSFNDGSARNNPEGTFPGSHNKHVVGYSKVCSVCHVTPATETSADFNHRNELIQIANPINGNTGASYSKGTSFLQTNTFTGGTCSNTYCHSDGTSVITGSIPANTSPAWGGTTTCQSCHGAGGNDDGRPNYANGTPKRNTHGDGVSYGVTHKSEPCTTCHTGISGTAGNYTITDTTTHNNGVYNLQAALGYNQSTGQCSTPGCHGSAVWGGTLGCTECHASAINSPVAQGLDSTVTQRRAIVPEFQQASNHVRNKAGGVTNADCGVCHMEGNASDGSINTTYHKNGYVELRDPDTGTTIKQATWSGTGAGSFTDGANDARFVRFSRNLTSHLEADANYANLAGLQKNHCLKCHDAGGATHTSAQVTGGTATNPFNANTGGIPGGRVVDVYSQFATTNRAYHPILGKQNNSYAANTRMSAPWNITKTNGNTTSWGYLMTCWDCHAPNGASGTLSSTVTAHGSAVTSATGTTNAVELRGYVWRTGGVSSTNRTTLCTLCHAGYDTTGATSNHGTGSALASNTNGNMTLYLQYACYYCHSSGPTKQARPIPGADAHGYNTRSNGTAFAAANYGYAFIRSEGFYGNGYNHSVANVGGTGYTAQCSGFNGTNGTTNCSRSSMGSYTPGGVY